MIGNRTHRSLMGSIGMGFDNAETPFRQKSFILPLESFSMLKGLSRSEMGMISPQTPAAKAEMYEAPERPTESSKSEGQGQNESPPWTVSPESHSSLNSGRVS